MKPLFVSFTGISQDGAMCNVCCQIIYDKPVEDNYDLISVTNKLAIRYPKLQSGTIVINNWRRFEEPE